MVCTTTGELVRAPALLPAPPLSHLLAPPEGPSLKRFTLGCSAGLGCAAGGCCIGAAAYVPVGVGGSGGGGGAAAAGMAWGKTALGAFCASASSTFCS